MANPLVTATLSTNPHQYFLHIDQSAALAAQLLKGVFAPDPGGTLQERLAAEIEDVKARRIKTAGSGVFLVFEGDTDIPTPEFKHRRDTDEFAVCLDAISKVEIRDKFRQPIQCVMTALELTLPAHADRRIEKIGDVVYLLDPENGKPIYTFNFQGGFARASVATPLTHSVIEESAALAPKIAANMKIARPVSLLITSLDDDTEKLQAFIAAWSAVEIFVNATFKATYEADWFAIMEDGAPSSAKPIFERLKDVMSDKYRLADKFLVIAAVLDSGAAAEDAAEFVRLKKFRDSLLHALEMPSSPLPTESVQKLMMKYMKLHLASQG